MSNLPVTRTGLAAGRTSRALAHLANQTEVAITEVAANTAIEVSKQDGLDIIAKRAMEGVALVSQMEQQYAQLVPIATSRLQAIGDIHALASANIVSSAPRSLS